MPRPLLHDDTLALVFLVFHIRAILIRATFDP
jgi:hypothetical protein